tara:strand:+ start:694 stop:1419 length:726 start_codon:yes stop_codon:yes gene_type:complete
MKFIKSLICTCLCLNSVNTINTNGLAVFKKDYPKKYNSFRKTKSYYYSKNIYYDIYKDSPIIINNKLLDEHYNTINYNSCKELTAEHIFPQSFLKDYPNAKFDMHNIFLTPQYTNNARSNYKFIDESYILKNVNNEYYLEINNKLTKYNRHCNYKNNKLRLFIPYYKNRGIIARSIAYMKLKYENIILENVIDLDILLYWNNLYPPTKIELIQNEKIKSSQGNYNHFIINPELVEYYFHNL